MSLHFSWACLICPPLILPRGSGQKQKLKAASAGDQEGKPSAGYHSGRANQRPKRQAPAGHRQRSPSQCRAPSSPRGCKGRSPLHKKTKNLPLPAGKGDGGMGRESKLKAGTAGDKKEKPPTRHRTTTPPPRRKGLRPPPGSRSAASTSAARVQPPGMQGAKPLA